MKDLIVIKIKKPEDVNVILGQTHFIKSVEDLHEALVESVPQIKFGLAFCEASGPCLVRSSGTDKKMEKLAKENALRIGAGHLFLIFLKNAYPVNVLERIKQVSEVCTIFCATANPVEVVVAETGMGRAILGVVDGGKSRGVEGKKEILARKNFLRTIGYKAA
jgi:adenosine/AMP kinase